MDPGAGYALCILDARARRSEYAARASRRKQLDVRARQRARAPARAAQA
jgi:hypothetical protein